MKTKLLPYLVATSFSMLAACGGGGGGGGGSSGGGGGGSTTVTGLDIPVTLSVVTAKESTATVKGLVPNYKGVALALNDPNTAYTTDPVHTHVYDSSIEPLETVNMILCLMDQTRAADMVNKGPYIALVNGDECESGDNGGGGQGGGQSSSNQATALKKWTIESTRADNNSPMLVKIWFQEKDGGGGGGGGSPMDHQFIMLEVTVTEGVSADKPFGAFTLNFKGVVDGAQFGQSGDVESMHGSLFTVADVDGKPHFKFINTAGFDNVDFMGGKLTVSHVEAANVILDDVTGTTGKAVTHSSENSSFDDDGAGPNPANVESKASTFGVAFNSTNFLRGSDTNKDGTLDLQICTSRDTFNTNIWRYNVYHAADGTYNGKAVKAGDRVELNSGFPFTYQGKWGNVSYWGVWYEGGGLPDGTTIQRIDYATNATTDYVVHVAPGKLMRRTASNELLDGYKNIEFNYWGNHPVYTSYWGQFHITYDGTDFKIVDRFEWGNNGPVSYDTLDLDGDPNTTGDIYPVAATLSLTDGQTLWLWSDILGGNITYVHNADVLAADRVVTLYSQDFVKPDDSQLTDGSTLYCYERCMKGGLTQADVNSATTESDLQYPSVGWDGLAQVGTPVQYTVSIANGKLTLMDGGNAVSLDGLDLTPIGNSWGNMQTGQMVSTALAADVQPWTLWQAPETYQWESGSNDWNKMVTVQKASDSTFASFDKPIELTYTHSTANDLNGNADYDGKKMRLQYGGNGELWGFPYIQEDPNCDSKTENCRWVTAVTLKDGVVLTDGTNNFVVKGIEREQTMALSNPGDAADITACTGSGLDVSTVSTDLPLPTANDVGTVSITKSDQPNVTAPPAVVEGELQQ